MPTADGLLRLESDTSIYAAGGVLYQKQDDEWVLLGFHSKRMPPEAAKYRITELELVGLVVNIHGFKHLLYARPFEVIVDHKALERLVVAKSDFPTIRMQHLLFKLRRYDFTIKYRKGKELVTSDVLSRLPFMEQTALADVIPLNFLIHLSEISAAALQQDEELLAQVLYPSLEVIVEQRNCNIDKQLTQENNPLLQDIQIPCQQKEQSNKPFGGIGLPVMVIAARPATAPTHQIRKQGRAVKHTENTPAEWVQNIYDTNPAPPQKRRNISTKYVEQVKQAVLPKEQPPSIIAQHIPKQEEIDSLLKEFRTKQLPEWKLNLMVSELIQGYLQSTRFRAIYLYICDNVLPKTMMQQKLIQAEAQNYVIINDLLVRLIVRKDYDPKEYDKPFRLVIPRNVRTSCVSYL